MTVPCGHFRPGGFTTYTSAAATPVAKSVLDMRDGIMTRAQPSRGAQTVSVVVHIASAEPEHSTRVLRGRGRLRIQDKWRGGPLNYLGLAVAGFPNVFHVAGPGSTSAFTNFFVTVEHHVDWIADCVALLDARGHATIEPSAEAEAAWVAFVNAENTVYLGCRSWYVGANVPGKPHVFVPLAGGFPAYARRCADVQIAATRVRPRHVA